MPKVKLWLSFIFIVLFLASVSFSQESRVDTRIWSISYWQKMVQAGLIEAPENVPVAPAQFTGSKIKARSVLINDSPDVPVTTDPNTTQSENSIFVNPLDNNKVLNSNNSTPYPVSTVYGTSGFMTADGGLTWTGQVQGTGGPNSGDPATAIDLNGTYFVGYIADNSGQGVARSYDEGQTWTHAQVAPNPGSLADKNHMWVDNSPASPHAGNVYSSWTDFGGPHDSEIVFSRSTDGGITWSPRIEISTAVNAGSHNQGVNITTGPNGEVYVFWAIYDSWPSDESAIGMAVSTDGGATFAPAVRIINNIRGIRNSETSKNMRVASFPSAAADISGGPRNGWLYVVWANIGVPGINSGSDIDVYMIRSTDGGSNWSTPIRVNTDPSGLGKEHYFPWITCDPEVGNLSVIFYDDRNVSSTQCEVFVANSVDGGSVWEDFKVSDVSFTPSPIPGLANSYFGDYIGISARGGKVYPVWTDNRSGRAMAYVSPFLLADPTDPNPPSNFEAYSDYTMPNSMQLTWTDPMTFANGDTLFPGEFSLYIERDGALLDTVPSGVEQFTDTGLNDGQVYSYSIYTRVLATDSVSLKITKDWTAGGAREPMAPSGFSVTNAGGGQLMAHWTNPVDNIDGTPMDDFDSINLYEDGTLLATFTRSSGDTGVVDSALFTPGGTNLPYYVTAVDNETPPNESNPSNTAFPPFSAPYLEDFEGATVGTPGVLPVQWTNEGGDDFDWYVNSGGTVSSGTGPLVDHTTGTAAGKYMYTEASSPNYPNKTAYLTTPFMDLSGVIQPGISFWYHMYGATMGELHVDVYYNGAWTMDVMPPLIGQQQANQTDPYLQALVDLSAYTSSPVQVRFRGITGSSYTGDIAIDDVYFTTLAGNPTMIVSTTEMSDTLLVGAASSQMFSITNATAAPSVLNYTITENPPVDWLTATPTSGAITSVSSEDITVDFDASTVAAGTYTTELIIAGDDPANPEDTILVTLVANEAPVIGITPDSVHFSLAINQVDSQTITITNAGGGPLRIFSIEDEEMNDKDWKPAFVQPQKPAVFSPKGTEGVLRGDVIDGSGGPDPFGYKWIDSDEPNGPAYQFTDISGTGTIANLLPTGTFDPKDEGMATLTLPWDIKFYGNSYNQIQVNSNGAIVLDMSFFSNMFSNVGIPNNADPNLYMAPFWDDLDGRAGGEIYYQALGNKFIVQWDHWGHYPSGTEGLIFQVVLFQNSSTIWYVYEDMAQAQTDATVGIENVDGTIGLEISHDQAYVHDQLLTKISKGAEWLAQNPTSGTVLPGGSLDIQLTADATGLLGGNYLANLVISSNDPVNPVVKLPKISLAVNTLPAIMTTPDSLLFDTTLVGNTPDLALLVKNTGNDVLNVTDITSTDPVFMADTTSFTVAPGANMPVYVKFSPLSQGDYSGWIVVQSNDPNTPLDSTYVQAVAVQAPVAVINPTFTNPVTVNPGDSVDIAVNIANTGNADLTWNAQTSFTMITSRPMTRRYAHVEPPVAADADPKPDFNQSNMLNDATWDIQFSFDLQAASGALGNAGAEFDGTFYYSTRWATNLIHRYDTTGALMEEFSIPGVSGLRDLAFDGTFMYGGAAGNTIYMMDFNTKQLIGTIPSPVAVRHIAYDSGNDAFWVGNWSTDIYLVDRNGATLNVIPAATHGTTSNYGSAYDNYTDGGPYLWVFSQGAGAGTPQIIYQLDLAAGGTQTGVSHDVTADFPGASNIAGGLWIGEGVVPGTVSIGGTLQGQPDMFFVYELTVTEQPWVILLNTSGLVTPGNNEDLNARVYGIPSSTDSVYIVVMTNDPNVAVTNILVHRNVPSGIEDIDAIPTTWAVEQNYPNPFNPTTTIKYQMPQSAKVRLTIFNVLGQKVRTLLNSQVEAGYHQVVWDGLNDTGSRVSSGIYIFRFESDNYKQVKKMILMK